MCHTFPHLFGQHSETIMYSVLGCRIITCFILCYIVYMVPLVVVVVLEKGIFSATAAAGLVIVCYQWVCVCRSALSLRNRK